VAKEAGYLAVDVAKETLDLALSNSQGIPSSPMTVKASHRLSGTSPFNELIRASNGKVCVI